MVPNEKESPRSWTEPRGVLRGRRCWMDLASVPVGLLNSPLNLQESRRGNNSPKKLKSKQPVTFDYLRWLSLPAQLNLSFVTC